MKDKLIYQGKFVGKGLLKYQWYSICSRHIDVDKNCRLCHGGSYTNVYKRKIGHIIYSRWPKLWVWYVNRPLKNKAKQNNGKRFKNTA